MSQTNWEADKMLDAYIYDYLVKRNLQQSAKAFQAEGKVSSDSVAIDAPRGILFEWWSVFWDIFIARTNEKHSDVAASYIEGLDQLRSGILQLQKSFMQSPQAFPQLQLLTPQHQQLLLQAQQNLSSPSAGDVESRKLRMLLNNRNIVLGKDGQSNSVGDVVQNVGSPMQAACPVLPQGDTDMLIKNQTGPVSSSSPANSSGTANTAGPSPSSAPSTPSTHTPGDVISISSLQHSGSSSPSNQLADIDRFDDGSSDDSVESCLSHKGFSFVEVASSRASTSKVVCCHFSSDGKLLATGGHDKKAVLWYTTNSLKAKTTLEEHSLLITDVRFSPSMPRLATSSFDKTVRVWDADNPGYSLRTFTGHSASVMSLDFHPNKEDLICSCDGDSEMRYWSINDGCCARVFKGGTTQMRFQPRLGRYLAAAAENIVSILDVETQACRHSLQGHTKAVHSVCWDPLGEFVASVSEDSVRVWTFGSGSEGELVHELSCYGNKFHSCVFHPTYPSILVIGCYQSLELWNMVENKVMTLPAHEGLIASLAVSNVTGLVASASHDNCVKLWE